MATWAKHTRPNVSGGAQGERWAPRADVKDYAKLARRTQDKQEVEEGRSEAAE